MVTKGPINTSDADAARVSRKAASTKGAAAPQRRVAATGARVATSARPVTSPATRIVPPGEVDRYRRARCPRVPVAAIAVVAVLAVVLAGAGAWFFLLRSISATVNGQEVSVRVGTPVADLMEENSWFGAVPGRLLSVGGNVLSEDGGAKPQVTANGEALAADALGTTAVAEGATYAVENGVDTTEPSREEQVALAPGIQMERGGAVQYVSQWGTPGEKTVVVGEQSGETIDKEVVTPAQDMVVSSISLKPQGGKYVALTFDDGPSKYTPQILEVLKSKTATATFYNLGSSAASNPAGVKAIVDAGCELASHTNSHQNLPTLDRDVLRSEISSAFDALESASGERVAMMRAPYGAFTDVEWARAGDLITCNVLWNIDTLDWKRPGAAAITSSVLNNAKNGSIILMHDGGGNRSQDVEALPGIIDGLRERGFELVTVSKLMELDGRIPENVVAGKAAMPEGALLPSA